MLKNSLSEAEQRPLQTAIIEGLKNQDGKARGSISSIYKRLSYKQIKPLLPAIRKAIVEPAPSGIMFSAQVRLSGVELFAKHHIEDGMELSLQAMELDKWGKKSRIKRCLNAIAKYGPAAKPILPQLRELRKRFSSKREVKSLGIYLKQLDQIIKTIETSKQKIKLKSI